MPTDPRLLPAETATTTRGEHSDDRSDASVLHTRRVRLTTVEPRSTCYRPKGHEGDCGEPIDQAEDETRILYGSCGAPPAPTGVIHVSDRGTRWV